MYLYEFILINKSEIFNDYLIKFYWERIMPSETRLKKLVLKILDMFVRTSVNESCVTVLVPMDPIVREFQTGREPRFAIGLRQRVNLWKNISRTLRFVPLVTSKKLQKETANCNLFFNIAINDFNRYRQVIVVSRIQNTSFS